MNEQRLHIICDEVISLLRELIATPSYSREEGATANILCAFLDARGIPFKRYGNNVIARTQQNSARHTWLLNSHHDTVKPAPGYTRDPFAADIIDGRLYGLGSNDAGGALVSLLGCFLYFYGEADLPCNLVFVASAEEEISGTGGISSILPELTSIDAAIVGEPTGMQLAVAERGLLVIDALATGRSGHAARKEGDNAILKAMQDIARLEQPLFGRVSPLLGPVTAQATVIETENKAHNVVPDRCRFVIDVRVNELYTLEEALQLLRSQLGSELTPRSLRLRSSVIANEHPLVRAGLSLGRHTYGSPTLSDKALMPFPALKMGPGDSARSHTPDEFIYVAEIREAVSLYIELLKKST